MTLRIRINRYVPFHVAETTYGPCDGSVVRVIELERYGTIVGNGDSFAIAYSVRALESDPVAEGATP